MVEVSIFIPAYKAAAFLPETVASLVNQDLPSYEIIIVNDASPDATAEVCHHLIKQYRQVSIHYEENPTNRGSGASRNRGAHLAQGDYLFNMDADDLLPPNTLRTLLDAVRQYHIEHGEHVIGAMQRTQYFMDKPEKLFHLSHPIRLRRFIPNVQRRKMLHEWQYTSAEAEYLLTQTITAIAIANRLFHRSIYETIGGYFEDCGAYDTWGFGVCSVLAGIRHEIIPGTYYLHRLHPDSDWALSEQSMKNRESLYRTLCHFEAIYTPETLEKLQPNNPDYPVEPFKWLKLQPTAMNNIAKPIHT